MECNSPRSTGRAPTSNRHPPNMNQKSSNMGELNHSAKGFDAQTKDDSILHENIGKGTDCNVGPPKEDERGEVRRRNSYSSPLVAQLMTAGKCLQHRESSSELTPVTVPSCMTNLGSRVLQQFDLLLDETIQPPVTISTLQELDLHSIQNNLNLRIDICHDPELFFQPVSGRKGEAKRTEAGKYWAVLAIEFQIYVHNAQHECSDCERKTSNTKLTFHPRLPVFFANLKDIVQMLVPESDHQEVADHLDLDLLMQQVRKGVLDAVRLSTWLIGLLTSHCAPMRDRSAAAVTEKIEHATEHSDMEGFVEGLEKLFALLEAMKLDIANHQIRSFRYPLIEGTVEFQQECFGRAIESEQIDISESQRWYRNQCFAHRCDCGMTEKGEETQRFASLIHGLVHLCSPYEKRTPLTFQYDQQRIIRLREDVQDHIQINLCLAVFDRQVQEIVGLHCDPLGRHEELTRRIICLTEDDEGNGSAISDHLEAIGVEIARAAISMQLPSRKSSSSLTDFEISRTIKLLHDVVRTEDSHHPVTKTFLHALEARTTEYTEQFGKMTTLDISNAQRHWAKTRTGRDAVLADWDEIARKLAHIGVVHWRVWRDICYWQREDHIQSDEPQENLDPEFLEVSGCDSSFSGAVQQELHQSMALGQGTGAIHHSDVQTLRQDSGFAESAESTEDLESLSTQEADLELDSEQDCRDTSSGNRSSKSR